MIAVLETSSSISTREPSGSGNSSQMPATTYRSRGWRKQGRESEDPVAIDECNSRDGHLERHTITSSLSCAKPESFKTTERFHVKSITQKPDHLQFCSNFMCLFTSMIEAAVPNFRQIGQVFLEIRPPKKLKFYTKNCA